MSARNKDSHRLPLLWAIAATTFLTACTERQVEARRGSWEVESRATWSLKDRRRLTEHVLFQQRGSSRVLVAERVRGYDFYSNDCVIFHASAPEAPGYFAACGLRQSLRISGPDDAWRKLGNEFQLLEHKGSEIQVRERRLVEDILSRALLQPPIAAPSR